MRAVVFGAGAIGRGFLGQLIADAGGATTFIDVDDAVRAGLNARRGYPLELVDDERVDRREIRGVDALAPASPEAVEALAAADLAATCVGARHLDATALPLALGLMHRHRTRPDAPLNVIVAENRPDAAAHLRGEVRAHVPPQLHGWFDAHAGFVDASIGRMVPRLTDADRAADPLLVRAEPYATLPLDADAWIGPRPAVPGFRFESPFAAVVETKRFLHNLGHAAAAYAGARRGRATLPECMADPEVAAHAEAAMAEAAEGLARKWNLDRRALADHAADLRRRFANRALGDTVARVAFDPLRKLDAEERLVGGVILAQSVDALCGAIAAAVADALAYDDPQDPGARQLAAWRAAVSAGKLDAEDFVVRATGLDGRDPVHAAALAAIRRAMAD